MKQIIREYIRDNNIEIDNKSNGIELAIENKELRIKGNKSDLIELADYIASIALSEEKKDHLHLDDLTIIKKDSEIKEIIIEKED